MNKITLAGEILTTPEYSHEVFGEKFYKFHICSLRNSGDGDVLPCIASEIFAKQIDSGDAIKILGEIRTFNANKHLELNVFTKEIIPYEGRDENKVELDGFICKTPIYRKTTRGREITDLLIATNRAYGKSDYIPTIVWGRNAVRAYGYPTGFHVCMTGRFQSREYEKNNPDGTMSTKIAYELSASRFDEFKEDVNVSKSYS